MIKTIQIYDLDGTIIDSSHRYRTLYNGSKITIDLDHWRANESRFSEDSLLPLAVQYKTHLADPDTYVIVVTARTEKHFNESRDWIAENLGLPDKIFCRPNGSMESGAVLKAKQLRGFLNLKQFANVKRYFYEDNKSYLDSVAAAVGAVPVFVPSKQGH